MANRYRVINVIFGWSIYDYRDRKVLKIYSTRSIARAYAKKRNERLKK